MRIVVIGTVIRDHIYHWDGSESHSLGGLLYTLLPLQALLNGQDELVPLCRVGADIYDEVTACLAKAGITRTEGLLKAEQPNNTVELRYISRQERQERSLYPLPPFTYEDIAPFLQADALFINMISGWELDVRLLERIRRSFAGPVFLDVHSLALGRKKDGLRYYRRIKNGADWLRHADAIQLNRMEWQFLAGNEAYELFLKECCFNQQKIVNLLLSWRGSKTFVVQEGKVSGFSTPPPAGITVTDPTGCGDAYLAGFGVEYLKSGDPRRAAQTANRCAALTGSFKGLPDSRQFKEAYRTLTRNLNE